MYALSTFFYRYLCIPRAGAMVMAFHKSRTANDYCISRN